MELQNYFPGIEVLAVSSEKRSLGFINRTAVPINFSL